MKTKFIMDEESKFAIEVNGERSAPAAYNTIANLTTKDGRMFIGVSAFYDGDLPIETVLEVHQVEGCTKEEFKGMLPYPKIEAKLSKHDKIRDLFRRKYTSQFEELAGDEEGLLFYNVKSEQSLRATLNDKGELVVT